VRLSGVRVAPILFGFAAALLHLAVAIPGSLATLTALYTRRPTTYVDSMEWGLRWARHICNLYIDSLQTMSVTFRPKPRVNVTLTSGFGARERVSAQGQRACSVGAPDCSDPVDPGATLTLTEVSAAGSTFSGWSGACSGSLSSCDILVTADTNVGRSLH